MDQFKEGISAITISSNQDYLAIALKTSFIIRIYKIENTNIQSCTLFQEISEHHQQISSLSFNSGDQLLSVSHDRNVFIYEQNKNKDKIVDGKFESRLVVAESSRAFYYGCWSRKANKFMLGGSKVGFIGYHKTSQHLWITKQIKGFENAIISGTFIDHDSKVCLGSNDFSFRVVSCKIKDIDQNIDPADKFGTVYLKIDNIGGWVNSIISVDDKLVLALSNNQIKHGDFNDLKTINNKVCLPFLHMVVDNESIYAAGFDNLPYKVDLQTGHITQLQGYKAKLVKKKSIVNQLQDQFDQKLKLDDKYSHRCKITSMCIYDDKVVTADEKGYILFWRL